MKLKVTVFCSSSTELAPAFYDTATNLGQLIAQNNYDLVYGGTDVGMMKHVADSAKKHGAKVFGVLPKVIHNKGIGSSACDEFILCEDMNERKKVLGELGDAFVALPGGFGTLEEFSEVLTSKQLGLHNKPIILLNTNGFYDGLLTWFDSLYETGMAREMYKGLFVVLEHEDLIIPFLRSFKPERAEDKY